MQNALLELALEEGFDWTRGLNEFEPEVLFLRGELNENMPVSHQRRLAAHYPSSRVVTLKGAGHQVLWERHSEALTHIRAYLKQLEVLP